MWNLVWDRKAIRENSVLFSLSKIWLLDAPKRREKFIPKRHMKKEIQKPGFEFNTGLALIDLQTTRRWIRNLIIFCKLQVWSQVRKKQILRPNPKEKANVFSTSLCLNIQHIVRQRQFPKKIKLYCSFIMLQFWQTNINDSKEAKLKKLK